MADGTRLLVPMPLHKPFPSNKSNIAKVMGITSKTRLQKGCNSDLSTLSCSHTLALREAAKSELLIGNMSSEARTQGVDEAQPMRLHHREVGWGLGRSEDQAVVGWWKEYWRFIFLLIHMDFIHR